MEGEVNNFMLVWSTILASLVYCHTIAKFIPQGIPRLLSFLFIICLFLLLPLNLTTIHFVGLTSFFISWLANFKLLLFAFGKGPLYSNPPIPLSRFIPIACFPIKILANPSRKIQNEENPSCKIKNEENPSSKISQKGKKSLLNYAIKIVLFVVLFKVYAHHKSNMHHYLKKLIYGYHIYFMLELILALTATLARRLESVELEPQFNAPYLATSLQDFWGRRWNLMVSRILHPSVYDPIRSVSGHLIPPKWAPLPSILATFLVSGIMHELIFYYIGRQKPTGEVTLFFVVHGICLSVEIILKKAVKGRFRLPAFISGAITLAFVFITSSWLFYPPYMQLKPDLKACKETLAFIEFIERRRLVSPNDVSCPYV